LLITIFSVASCQTAPSSPTASAKQEPIHNLKLDPPLGKASLVLIRPAYVAYALRGLSIKVNGNPAAELSNRSYTVLYVNSGSQKIESEGGFLSWSKKEKIIEASENQVIYVLWYIQDGLAGYANKVFDAQWQVVTKEVATEYLSNSTFKHSALDN
jgi:hypothetical protein